MQTRNKDALYVSNATTVEATKFMNYVRLIVGTVNNPIVAATNVYILKDLAQGTSSAVTVSGEHGSGRHRRPLEHLSLRDLRAAYWHA
jgi:hypothetical protein